MTLRAVAIGLVLALAVASLGYANDWLFLLPYVASDLMPVSVYGLLVLVLLTVNPALKRLGRRRFSAAELAVMFSLVLAACVIPGPGLLWHFHNTLLAPVSFQETLPGYGQTAEHPPLLSYVPPIMLANDGRFDERAVKGFLQGMGRSGHMLDPRVLPWEAWVKPYAFYLPLLLAGYAAVVCLAVIVHRQWAYREHLPYPLAEVAGELLRDDPVLGFNPIFHNRLFWSGFAVAFGILLINGLKLYYPNSIQVPTSLDLTSLGQIWPKLAQVSRYWNLFNPRFFFAVIGLAYLLSSEVSFSVGISNVVFTILALNLMERGVDMANDYMAGGVLSFMLFGAYVGGGLMVLYTGRKFYHAVLKRSLGLSSGEPVEKTVVLAGRMLLVLALGLVLMLRLALGLDVLLAVLLLGMIALTFVIVTRINVETGLLFVQPTWQGLAILAGFFGSAALGPRALIIAGVLCLVLTVDPRVCLMPLVVNALKVSDRQQVPPGRLGRWLVVVLAACLAVGVPATLYVQYSYGADRLYGWANPAAQMPFDMLDREADYLAAQDALETAGRTHGLLGLERLLAAKPSHAFKWAVPLGLALMLSTSFARLRWPWWPIHPVMFMVWGTIISGWFAPSFLTGWLIKTGITRFGGGKAYAKAKPFFIGLIAGEMVMGIVWMVVGGLYYYVHGAAGPTIRVHP